MRPRFNDDDIRLLHEAVDYHYLTDLSGYGVPVEELSETEAETYEGMIRLNARLSGMRSRIEQRNREAV